jgi:hypothetical protein
VLLPSGGRRSIESITLATAFLAGAVVGVLALVPTVFVGKGLVSPIPQSARDVAGIALAAAILVVNVVTRRCPLPQVRRQIPQRAIAARRPHGAFTFGAALGTGLLTYLPSCAPHVLLCLLVFLDPIPAATVAAAVGFGVGRSAGLLVRAVANDRARFEVGFQRMVVALSRGVASGAVLLLVLATDLDPMR